MKFGPIRKFRASFEWNQKRFCKVQQPQSNQGKLEKLHSNLGKLEGLHKMEQLLSNLDNIQKSHWNLGAIRNIWVNSNSHNQIWLIETASLKFRHNQNHLCNLDKGHSEFGILWTFG